MNNVVSLVEWKTKKSVTKWDGYYRYKDWLEVLEEFAQYQEHMEKNPENLDKARVLAMLHVMIERAETEELKAVCRKWLEKYRAA